MTNAAAIATLVAAAPGRVAIAIGAGFTGRNTLGQKPMRWADVEAYVAALRGLLLGETVEWEGAPMRMMHSVGFGARRPIDVPILIGVDGARGHRVAERAGDGIFAAAAPNANAPAGAPHHLLQFGTILDEGEDIRSRRVMKAVGHAVAVLLHALYESGGAEAVRRLPGGATWAGAITALSLSGTAEQVREKATAFEVAGLTDIAYQPAGPDIPGELVRMARALI